MATILEEKGTITITYTKDFESPDADEESLVFWLFKVLRQFGLEAEIETNNETYDEDIIDKKY